MATAKDLRRLALALEGTLEYPHFDRAAFKATRTYVTLAPDGRTANFKFAPDEQELKCAVAPDAFTPIPNAWGRQGWTVGKLSALSIGELRAALVMAYAHGSRKKKPTRRRGVPKTWPTCSVMTGAHDSGVADAKISESN